MKLEEEFTLDYDNCYTSIALEVENVSFTFPDSKNKILNNINLNIDQANVSLLTEQTVLKDNLDTHIVRINSA
jgi:ABC-type transport system involved in cytochrome bd biosynthesis fused ATPase/permease subunit